MRNSNFISHLFILNYIITHLHANYIAHYK